MKSDEDVLDEDLNVGSEDVEASSQEDLDLSNLLSLEMTVIFTDGVKGVTGIPAEAYKISGNTVVINLSSSEDSQEFSVEGYVSGDVYKSYALPAVSALPFTDVKTSDYFYKAVLWAYTAQPQITDGMSPTLFGTGKTCTRGQVVTFLWRTAGCPEPKNAQNPFTDVAASDYFYKPVLWAVEQGITDGTSPTAFSPAKPCTNAHIITFIYRAVGEPGKTANPAAWYTDAYFWAGEHKLLTGTYTGTFDLNAPCPRENVVTYLYRYNESK